MPNLHEIENAMPVAPLKIVALSSAKKMGKKELMSRNAQLNAARRKKLNTRG